MNSKFLKYYELYFSMARRGKEKDLTKSGQLRRRGQYRIKHTIMMIFEGIIADISRNGLSKIILTSLLILIITKTFIASKQ